jgi:hypothetical protein
MAHDYNCIGAATLFAALNRPQQFIQLGVRCMQTEQKEVAENDSGQSLLPPVTLVGESHRNGERAKNAF